VDQIRPIGRTPDGPAPVPPVVRMTKIEREEAGRERERRRRDRARSTGRPSTEDEPPEGGGGLLDVRA
jgi:hypothetical protein